MGGVEKNLFADEFKKHKNQETTIGVWELMGCDEDEAGSEGTYWMYAHLTLESTVQVPALSCSSFSNAPLRPEREAA